MRHSTGKPTKLEATRIEAMLRLGCICCARLNIPYLDVECHHLLQGNKRMGHWFTIPLCAGHHRGQFTKLQRELIPEGLQIAISNGSKEFTWRYGTERDLWERIQQKLKLPLIWPTSKIVPKKTA